MKIVVQQFVDVEIDTDSIDLDSLMHGVPYYDSCNEGAKYFHFEANDGVYRVFEGEPGYEIVEKLYALTRLGRS